FSLPEALTKLRKSNLAIPPMKPGILTSDTGELTLDQNNRTFQAFFSSNVIVSFSIVHLSVTYYITINRFVNSCQLYKKIFQLALEIRIGLMYGKNIVKRAMDVLIW
ncbi:MAG: hypothetical protein PHS41_05875, partial [Victivallaceae bacterium]|nr:hypothetical protein [Victivallaceae bacterium]